MAARVPLVLSFVLVVHALAATPAPGAAPADAARDSIQWLLDRVRGAEAESLARVYLHEAEAARPADSSRIAWAHHAIGHARLVRRALRDSVAVKSLERSLGIYRRLRPPDSTMIALVDLDLGRVLYETGQTEESVAHFERGLRLRPGPRPNELVRANCWDFLGHARRRLRMPLEALDAYDGAIEIRLRLGDDGQPGVASTLRNKAAALMDLWRYAEAREALERSLEIYARHPGPRADDRAASLNQLASLEYRSGDVATSLDLTREALELTKRVQGRVDFRSIPFLYNIGLRLIDLGDYRQAHDSFDRALALDEATFGPGRSGAAATRMLRGVCAAALGDTAAGRRDLERALASLARGPETLATRTFILRWLGDLDRRRGDLARADGWLAEARANEQANPAPSYEALAAVFETWQQIQRAAGDRAGLDRTVRAIDSLTAEARLHGTLGFGKFVTTRALANQALGRTDAAWRDALLADELERERQRLNAERLPERQALWLQGETSASLDVLVDLARSADAERCAVAWDRITRWRGLVATAVARRRAPPVATATGPVAAHARWLDAQRQYAAARIAGASAVADSGMLARLEQLRDAAERAEREFAGMAGQEPWFAREPEPGFGPLLARLGRDAAIVGVYEIAARSDTARTVAFIARGGDPKAKLVDLGPSRELRAALDPWLAALGAPPAGGGGRDEERAARLLGERVRRLTWDELARHLAASTEVFLVPDGPLHELPWQALPVGSRDYLAERGPVLHVLDSEGAIANPGGESLNRGLLAIGGPQFDAAPTGRMSSAARSPVRDPLADCDPAQGIPLAPLPAARAEVEDVARTWGAAPGAAATTLVDAEATEEALRREAPGREILHLATHGIMWSDSCRPATRGLRGVGTVAPLESDRPRRRRPAPQVAGPKHAPAPPRSPWLGRQVWLALAGAGIPASEKAGGDDGLVTAEEVVTLDLRGVDWVVLSACHSGVGESWPNEGAQGMRRAFRLAGAGAVIASQWAVGDQSTREWMASLYRARAAGARSAAAAMQRASREVLAARRAQGRSTHPFWWAAFQATGK